MEPVAALIVVDAATSAANDAAYASLEDVSWALEHDVDGRVVGGHMVSLLSLAFPVASVFRRTVDADAGISMQLASSGDMHRRLLSLGYAAENGNRYRNADQVIDLLVPSGTDQFDGAEHGGREFDAVPGLGLAIGGKPFQIEVEVSLTSGDVRQFTTRIPTVEYALILKAYAAHGRNARKDLIDLHNLLSIVDVYDAEQIGGWRIGDAQLTGVRLDVSRYLHVLAGSPVQYRLAEKADIDPARLRVLIRRYIGGISNRKKS